MRVFTCWDYPDAKGPNGGTWSDWCDRECDRVNKTGRSAVVVCEKNGRLKDGVARIAVARVK